MFGQDDTTTPYEWWAGGQAPIIAEAPPVEPSESRFIPIYQQEAGAIDAALQAQSTGGFFDSIKSVIQTLSPLATSVIKATTARTIPTSPSIITPGVVPGVKPSTAGLGGLFSSPLMLGGIAVAAYMFLRGRGKGKRRR